MTNRFLLALVCFPLLFGCGVPPDGVTWLPDSTGFVFVSGTSDQDIGKDIQFFDLVNKTQRVIAANTGTVTLRPAVSPDGKLIVVARVEAHAHKPAQLQLVFYDRAGKVQKQSSSFLWSPTRKVAEPDKVGVGKRNGIVATWLQWEPASQKLIVAGYDGNDGQRNVSVAAYDPHSDQLLRLGLLDGHPRWVIRPDGKGFLQMDKNSDGLVFTEWDGSRRVIAFDSDSAVKWKQSVDAPPRKNTRRPQPEFRWERNTLVLFNDYGSLRLDTDARAATFDPIPRVDRYVDGKLVDMEHEFPDAARLRWLVSQQEALDNEGNKSLANVTLLEWFESRTGQRRTVLPVTATGSIDVAPNGKFVALRNQDRIHVIDSQGAIVANLDATNKKAANKK